MKDKVLYLSPTGMTESLGISQVYNYISRTSREYFIYLISIEKEIVSERLNDKIKKVARWKYFTVSGSKLSTIYALLKVFFTCLCLIKKENIKIVHARSFKMAFIALVMKLIFGVKVVFDIRGFWVDELMENQRIKSKYLYRILKKIEDMLYDKSDVIITLTDVSKKILESKTAKPIYVIPTCVDLEMFNFSKQRNTREENDNINLKKIVYVGPVEQRYSFERILGHVINLANEIDLEFHVFSQDKVNAEKQILQRNLTFKTIVSTVSFDEMPSRLMDMDFAIFIMKESFSTLAMAPTKFAEFLACGLPVIINDNGSDVVRIVDSYNVGVIINDQVNYEKLAKELSNKYCRNELREVAKNKFNIDHAAQQTCHIYGNLMVG